MSTNLKSYIADVRTLEIQKETLSRSISSINYNINQLCHPKTITPGTNPIDLGFWHMFSGRVIAIVAIVAFAVYFASMGAKEEATEYLQLATGQMVYGDGGPYYIVANIFGGIAAIIGISMIIQYIVQKKRHDELEQNLSTQYRSSRRQEDERIAREREIQNRYKEAERILSDCYAQTCNTLNALYSKNVIYPKYQNDLVAICMFYEYLDSERCTSLKGHEGAYNIYEQELRMGIIINQNEIIIQKLDEIRQNQYYLYAAIQNINDQQSRIVSSLNNVAYTQSIQNEKLEYIQYNTTAMKRNSDISLLYALF